MSRHLRLLVLASFVGGCGGSSEKTLVILHTTDEHSHLIGFGPELDDYPAASSAGSGTIVGGIGRRSALIAQERAAAKTKGADSLLVSAGDNTMGTLIQAGTIKNAPDFELMKTLGYDVSTLGNHEFDFGPAGLALALQAASSGGGLTPTVSTNLHFSDSDSGDDTLAALYDTTGSDTSKLVHQTWTVTTAGGLKVGFIGLVGVDAAKKATQKTPVTFSVPAGGTESDDVSKVLAQVYADLQPAVDSLRAQKVDLVIALSHAGVDAANMTMGEDYQIAQNVSGIDVIVSGHTHLPVDVFTVTNTKTGKPVYIQQANCFGQTLGKMTVKVSGGKVTLDTTNTSLINVDDKTVSDATLSPKIDDAISKIEADSFLPNTLGIITGSTITDDTSKVGDLYFYPIGKTSFTVLGKADQKDTPLMDLWADAELLAAEAATGHTDISLVAQGALRADLNQGKTGVVSFADVFRAVPLGSSPNMTIGYPLCKTYILAAEVKAAFEVAAGYAYTSSDAGDFYLAGGGVKVEYDTSRPQFNTTTGSATDPNNGRVTKMTIASDHTNLTKFDKVIFDLSQGGWVNGVAFSDLYSVTGNLYVVQFAYVAGVTLKDSKGVPGPMPTDTIVHRADSSEVKDWEAVSQFIRSAPQMTVPASYMTASHMVCSGPLCK
jgi:5'-nucleotidase / UDP-sugar diphosphatase